MYIAVQVTLKCLEKMMMILHNELYIVRFASLFLPFGFRVYTELYIYRV